MVAYEDLPVVFVSDGAQYDEIELEVEEIELEVEE